MNTDWFRATSGVARVVMLAAAIFLNLGWACAEEPSALDAAQAIEKSVVETIARCEKSVVAVARVRRPVRSAEAPLFERAGRIGPRIGGELAPTDPDFVAHEYAAGVVVDAKGLIVTTYHSLGNVEECDYYVWTGKRPFAAKLRAADPWLDLAVLQIEANDLVPVSLGDARKAKKGQLVVVLGNPLGIARDGEASAGWGIVANLGRRPGGISDSEKEKRNSLHHYGTLLQIDARLAAGASGGAVVNLRGELIGLTTALAAGAGSDVSGGFAIPVDDVFVRSVETLKQGKKVDYGFLGVAPENLALEERQKGKRGALVYHAVPGTPADKAGLRPENALTREVDVVTHVNDRPVVDAEGLFLELSRLPPNEAITMEVERGKRGGVIKPVRLTTVLWKKGDSNGRPAVGEESVPFWRGMRIDYPSAIPAFHQRTGAIDLEGCVGVADVQADSPAWKAGLRPGVFVSMVEGKRISSPEEFLRVVAGREGKPVRMVGSAGKSWVLNGE